MRSKKPRRNILLSTVDKKYRRNQVRTSRHARYDNWVGAMGVPIMYDRGKYQKTRKRNNSTGQVSLRLGRHIETVEALQDAWECATSEVFLRFLRPLFIEMKAAVRHKRKYVKNPLPPKISLRMEDWVDEELNP